MSESIQPDPETVIEDNRDVLELVADGDDGAAELAQNILAATEESNA